MSLSTLNVFVLGDLQFANEALMSVARLFEPGGEGYNQIRIAASVMLLLMLFLSSFKYILDPERSPYPVKEFAFGLIGFMIFVGPATPRYTVNLHSLENPLQVRTVTGVPMLVAVPPWLVSNLFGGIRDTMRNHFSPPGMNVNAPQDPLGALVRLHSIPMNASINTLNNPGRVDFARSFRNYFRECYEANLVIGGGDGAANITQVLSSRYDQALANMKVDYEDFYTVTYLDPSAVNGTYHNCKEAHAALMNFQNDATTRIVQDLENKGVSAGAISEAHRLLFSGNPGPNPHQLMAGRFTAFHIAEGLATSNSPWVDKMVFEAMQQRVYQQAGERSLFVNYMVPMITMFEVFAFYIAPIIVILSVMGGTGFAMIGKYLYLVFFVNLWGFVKVFVDLYTYMATERAFRTANQFQEMNPLALQQLPNTIVELEGFLGVAAALTAAIPMLSMFLLYGGVHSLMGVMSSINPTGKGNVDASNAAPSIASPWNNGTASMGVDGYSNNMRTGAVEMNTQQSSSGRFGELNYGTNFGNAVNATSSITNQNAETAQQQFQQMVSDQAQSIVSNQDVIQGARSRSWADQNTAERLWTAGKQISDDLSISHKEGVERAIVAANQEATTRDASFYTGQDTKSGMRASIGVQTPSISPIQGGGGGYFDVSGSSGMRFTDTNTQREAQELSERYASGAGTTVGEVWRSIHNAAENHKVNETISEDVKRSRTASDSFSTQVAESFTTQNSAIQQIAQSRTLQESVGENFGSDTRTGQQYSINQEALAPIINEDDARAFYQNMQANGFGDVLSKDFDEYMAAGLRAAGTDNPEQAAYGAMHQMYRDINAQPVDNLDQLSQRAGALSLWAGSLSEAATARGAQTNETGALNAMREDYSALHRELEGFRTEGEDGAPGEIDNQARNESRETQTGPNVDDARNAANVIENSDLQGTELTHGEYNEIDNYAPPEDFTKINPVSDKVINRVQNAEDKFGGVGDLVREAIENRSFNSATAPVGSFEGEHAEQNVAAMVNRTAENGHAYNADNVNAGLQHLLNSERSDYSTMFNRIAAGNATDEDIQKFMQTSEALAYLANEEGGSEILGALTNQGAQRVSHNAAQWNNAQSSDIHGNNDRVRAANTIATQAINNEVPNAVGLAGIQVAAGENPGGQKPHGYNHFAHSSGWMAMDAYRQGHQEHARGNGNFVEKHADSSRRWQFAGTGTGLSERNAFIHLGEEQLARTHGLDSERSQQALSALLTNTSLTHEGNIDRAVSQMLQTDGGYDIASNPQEFKAMATEVFGAGSNVETAMHNLLDRMNEEGLRTGALNREFTPEHGQKYQPEGLVNGREAGSSLLLNGDVLQRSSDTDENGVTEFRSSTNPDVVYNHQRGDDFITLSDKTEPLVPTYQGGEGYDSEGQSGRSSTPVDSAPMQSAGVSAITAQKPETGAPPARPNLSGPNQQSGPSNFVMANAGQSQDAGSAGNTTTENQGENPDGVNNGGDSPTPTSDAGSNDATRSAGAEGVATGAGINAPANATGGATGTATTGGQGQDAGSTGNATTGNQGETQEESSFNAREAWNPERNHEVTEDDSGALNLSVRSEPLEGGLQPLENGKGFTGSMVLGATSGDNRLAVRGEGQQQSPTTRAANQGARLGAQASLMSAMHSDQNLQDEFNTALHANDGAAPSTFSSSEYGDLSVTSQNGPLSLYEDENGSRFAHLEGDNRIMPLDDNRFENGTSELTSEQISDIESGNAPESIETENGSAQLVGSIGESNMPVYQGADNSIMVADTQSGQLVGYGSEGVNRSGNVTSSFVKESEDFTPKETEGNPSEAPATVEPEPDSAATVLPSDESTQVPESDSASIEAQEVQSTTQPSTESQPADVDASTYEPASYEATTPSELQPDVDSTQQFTDASTDVTQGENTSVGSSDVVEPKPTTEEPAPQSSTEQPVGQAATQGNVASSGQSAPADASAFDQSHKAPGGKLPDAQMPLDAVSDMMDSEQMPQQFETDDGEVYTYQGVLGSVDDPLGHIYSDSDGNAYYSSGYDGNLDHYGDLSDVEYEKVT